MNIIEEQRQQINGNNNTAQSYIDSLIQNMNKLFAKFQHYMDKISTRVKENLQGVRVVKSFNQGENEIKRFNETSDDLNELNIKIGYCISTIMPAFMLIAYLVIALVVFLV